MVVVCIVVLLVVTLIWFHYQRNNSGDDTDAPVKPTTHEEPAHWAKTRLLVEEDVALNATNKEIAWVEPKNGTFQSTYEEDGRTLTTSIDLRFHVAKSGGWTITGGGNDADGDFCVLEGLLSPTGTVYWMEECSAGKVFSSGKFSLDGKKLEGTWEAANGVSGSYQDFHMASASDTDETDDEEPEIPVKM